MSRHGVIIYKKTWEMELKNKKNIKNELLRKRREKEEVRSEEYMEKEGTEGIEPGSIGLPSFGRLFTRNPSRSDDK
ncbi:hypothetical protein M8J75_008588 [Diaphorina citri]|nr:hypothetical protein M8J75_008588 [Diaphorina citri]